MRVAAGGWGWGDNCFFGLVLLYVLYISNCYYLIDNSGYLELEITRVHCIQSKYSTMYLGVMAKVVFMTLMPGSIAQSVLCLTTDLGVISSNPSWTT